jgi:hypothetical protein
MTADLAALTITAAYVFAGAGVLAAAEVLPSGIVATVGWACLAYVAGLAVTMLVCIALVCVGVAIHGVVFALVSVVVGGAGIGIRMLRGERRWRPQRPTFETWSLVRSVRAWSVETWLVAIVAVIGVAYVVLGYRSAGRMPLNAWDAWSIWARKATILFDYGNLPIAFFGSPNYAFMHPDYPLLVPMFESIWFRFVGGPDTQSLHVEFWLLFVTSLGAVAYISSRVARPAIWAPLIGLVAVIPAVTGQLLTLYADVPMGLLLMIGALLLGIWIERPGGSPLALATLFLAAAANTKNEGLTAAVCVLGAAFLVTALMPRTGGRRADFRSLLIAAGAFVVMIAPWRLWLAVHHIGGDMPIGKGLDPSYLASRADRISPTLTALYAQITDQSAWYYVLPLAIGVVLACLLVRDARRPAAFYGLTGIAIFVVIVWAYVINPNAISWLIATSANRTVDGLMFAAIAALVYLTGTLVPSRGALQQEADHEISRSRDAARQPATEVAGSSGRPLG